ncbi:efflux RND transporter periplasmic adaptor subunit [Neolewinella lacunae]|uniref:Efflux RND transporter periplasmic adaptor subunit n=1 Tax=Neolewinella lacunae TaxID=1517758 RepID=A0A923PNI4_9BACT|nr:efflux RND transporter periplasmic adaptor subunit [Neolewinella lacunae]MBC6995976.1 efflux RND transporter periplasmic adaptor subunit [Neolewinella lacunae]MDN3635180.1 efflux RND transporter periplasmic adaptor subunit [Neolewinella lacunae]
MFTPLHLTRWLLPLCLFFAACGPPAEDPESDPTAAAAASPAEVPLVQTVEARVGRLPLRRQATGKLRARNEVVIKSQLGGPVLRAPQEGALYAAGDLLLSIDPRPLELARDRAAAARDEAAFRRRDLLLRLSPEDSTLVSALARENILIQSGLPAAEVALAEATFQLSLARLTAPFAGRVADVKIQPGQQISPGEEVCTLIDPRSLEAEFSLLEQEIALTQVLPPGPPKGGSRDKEQGKVYVSPIARPELRLAAVLDILNPRIDDGGLLRARARLVNPNTPGLYAGMNVAVSLESAAPPAIVVPKTAVLIRSGRTLVFTYDEATQRAKWQYVTVAYENDESVALSEGVTAGQRVIINGGLTLDHDSPVRVGETN